MCMYARIADIYTFSFIFLFYFLFIKRKVSETMPFSSELWERNGNNFRKNVLYFGRNKNYWGRNAVNFGKYCLNLGKNGYKWGNKNAERFAPGLRSKCRQK